MNSKQSGRRRFLKDGAVLAGLAVGAIRSASGQAATGTEPQAPSPPVGSEANPRSPAERGGIYTEANAYGVRSRFVTSVRKEARTPLQDVAGFITPAPLHFVVDHGSGSPDIDPRQHRLLIHGLVDRPLIFTLDELKRLPAVSRVYFLACAGNSYLPLEARKNAKTVQETHGWTGCSEWTGVPLSLLLKEVGVQEGGTWIQAEGAEIRKLASSIPMAKALDDVLVAYSQNGEPVRPEQGYPLRLVVPGFEGIRNVKWLRRIKVVDRPYMMKYESTIYTNVRPDGTARWFQFELETNSVITFPSGGQQLPGPGFYEITGLAWSGGGAIRRVEVSADGGRTWKDAQLQQPVFSKAHTRFRFPWNWDGKEAVLQSRSTNEWGEVQPTKAEIEKMWGVTPDYWLTTKNRIQHFNAIQPWKLTRDGSVQNAMFT